MRLEKRLMGLLRYNTVLSLSIILVGGVWLASQTDGFSWQRNTYSELVLYLDGIYKTIFRALFVIKMVLDLGFTYVVFVRFNVSWRSWLGLIWLVSVILMGVVGMVTVEVSETIHAVLAWLMFASWTIAELMFALKYTTQEFWQFTVTVLVASAGLVVVGFVGGELSVIIEMGITLLSLGWIVRLIREMELLEVERVG